MEDLLDPYAIFNEGMKRKRSSKFVHAAVLFEEAGRLSGRDMELKLDSFFALADTFRMVGEFVGASKNYRLAEKLALKLAMPQRAVDASVGLALSLRARGEFSETIKLLNRALRKYRSDGDRMAIAFTLWARAGAYRVRGDVRGALSGFKESKELFSKLKDRAGVGYCLTGLGGSARIAGDYNASFRYYSQANKLFKELRDTFGVAYSYCGLANSLRMKGDLKEAGAYFKLAKGNYKRIGDKVSFAYTLWGEGSLYQITGKRALAKRDLLAAELLFKETGDRRGLVYCELGFAQSLFLDGKEKEAVRRLKGTLRRAVKLSLKTEAGYARELLRAIEKDPGSMPLNLP